MKTMHSIAAAVPALVLAACSTTGPRTPDASSGASDIPAAIAVPSGNRLAMRLNGAGLEVYECRVRSKAAGYDWMPVGPEAVLKDPSGAIMGRHFAGPTWEHGDGSQVTGKPVADVEAPQSGNIRWLLLSGESTRGPGLLADVTYVQRIDTGGGIAPSESCTQGKAGVRRSVPFTAAYLFYKH